MRGLILNIVEPFKKIANKNFIHYWDVQRKAHNETLKNPSRTDIINFLFSTKKHDTTYLEIGVRNPNHNFNHIKSNTKYSVDPGVEFRNNPVDFKMTSDAFFEKLSKSEILSKEIKFDIIFIDGLHLAEQVDKDIKNAISYIKDDGFIVLHDCNPPTEWHAREKYFYTKTPAKGYWNGTTWKAFLKARFNSALNSCCINTDWGVGILSKKHPIGKSIEATNLFFEFEDFDKNRKEYLNLISFEDLKKVMT
ncbi:MAG: class I SAM-dependent methyltransferase [Saprospiraceae bacterium]